MSTTSGAADTSKDTTPGEFVRSILELSARKDHEDMERYQVLEAEAQKRRARREERAQSISPERVASTNNLARLRSPTAANAFSTPPILTPSAPPVAGMDGGAAHPGPPSPTKDIPEFKGFGSVRNSTSSTSSVAQTPDRNSQPSPSATSLARSGTLSWQRRPASRGGASRPMSVAGVEGIAHARTTSVDQQEPSREQIAASLATRDPAWFRQTPDRGAGSGGLRKSEEEAGLGDNMAPGRRGLPGLSREPPTTERPSSQSDSTSRHSSARDSASSRFSGATSTSTPSKPDLKSLVAADEPQLQASPMSDNESSIPGDQPGLGRTLTMSSSQARLGTAPDRPSSPTKGMGGFVQSAMMKRSDSVSKRWSAQPGASLSRHNSLASFGGLQGSHSMPRLEPTSRETSNEPVSRPSSSSSNLNTLAMTQGRTDNDGFVKPALPRHNRSQSVVSTYSTSAEDGATSPPSSPSKRYSPTKSSWIESALTRPDSPKPSAPKNSQPSWMVNIAKAKAERASADSTPRTGTPKLSDPDTPKSASPTKATPFGQGMLKRSDSRDLAPVPRSSTPPFMRETPGSQVDAEPESTASAISDAPLAATHDEVSPQDTSSKTPVQNEINLEHEAEPEVKLRPEPEDAPLPRNTPAEMPRTIKDPLKSPAPFLAKPKQETPPKSPTDFRSALRSRAPTDTKKQDTPEFLSRFGNLRKTQAEKFVAPDVLKDNITRGKADLSKTGGPVKTARKDELRESLLAKKQDWQNAKEESRELPGQVHERKISTTTPVTPPKPEALVKKDLLARSDSDRIRNSPDKAKQNTPEAKPSRVVPAQKPTLETAPAKKLTMPGAGQARFELLSKQASAPAELEHKTLSETSRLAARFNPGLAGILGRGPPAASSGARAPSPSGSTATLERSLTAPLSSAPNESSVVVQPLEDMRKGRARGPKKRKQGGSTADDPATKQDSVAEPDSELQLEAKGPTEPISQTPTPIHMPKPRAPPGPAASLMAASPRGSPKPLPKEPEKPATPAKNPTIAVKAVGLSQMAPKPDVPEISSGEKPVSSSLVDDNKENADDNAPSVKNVASFWGKQPSPNKTEPAPQIQLPSKRDEEAAMRSAGLLATQPSSKKGLGISVEKSRGQVSTPPASAGLPPRPAKSSRSVSGLLQEASPNKGPTDSVAQPTTEAERLLIQSFGSVPVSSNNSRLDVSATIANAQVGPSPDTRTLRRTTQEVTPNGSLRLLPPQDEYTLFDESTYICTHTHAGNNGVKVTQVFTWHGDSAIAAAKDQALAIAKRIAKDESAQLQVVQQGHESLAFLQTLGGILVTRRGVKDGATKQYMLCGRKHIGHITFDEVDFGIAALCSGFVYLVSYPTTLTDTKLYLWKGSACSTEEVSAARLAAMDLSETGEIIEVDDGAEFASFLKVFGRGTMKSSIPKSSDLWRQKALAPEHFEVKLFKIRQVEQRGGIFAGMFRRPSWGLSPARPMSTDVIEVKVEVKHISPFKQADLEAEGIYLLDAFGELYVLIGPLFASQVDNVRAELLGQTLLFTADYMSAAAGSRSSTPKAHVLFGGVPRDMKMLFRHWDDSRGLWGTAGLMAGSLISTGSGIKMVPLRDVIGTVCRK
ncbi:hypothetical protein LTR08_009133 [Meristemomyces frigidus]|nr:hypothetical protein LTR08_009133 [Meristemomyces frigidus]